MKQSLAIVVSAGILLASVAAPPAGATAVDPSVVKPPLAAQLAVCTTGVDAADRTATFSASMPALRGTRRMQMRFVLFQRRGQSGAFKQVKLPEWGAWEVSDPGRPGFVFTKRVDSLLAPAGYRAVVTFRWYDRKGRLQRQATRTTPTCAQPDPRPDLVLAAFDATTSGAPAGQALYRVLVRNDGFSTADPFGVAVTVAGVQSAPITVGPLAAGAQQEGTITGPRCQAGSTVTIQLDVGGVVTESHEADDTVQRACPL